MAHEILTAARLRELLHYDQLTGVFTWRVSRQGRWNIKAGSIAGYITNRSYIEICIDCKRYYAHRLAWLYTDGKWPDAHIDHIDGERGNNARGNLRDVSRSVNNQNRRQPGGTNTSGFLGVSWNKARNKWGAKIRVSGKNRHLGLFETAEAAHSAYLFEKRRFHPGCTL